MRDRVITMSTSCRSRPCSFLSRQEVSTGNRELLLDVAGDFDHLEAVVEGGGSCRPCSRCRQTALSTGPRGVDAVHKGRVLLRVQDPRSALVGRPEVRAELVDLIQDDDGVVASRTLDGIDQATREGADVGATMSSNSASSFTPPVDALVAPSERRAMLCPRVVLPTPGGPTKQRIGALPFDDWVTARCSRIRSLTS